MPRIRRRFIVAFLGVIIPAVAQTLEAGLEGVVLESMFDTEHMFGFAEGSDINEEGVTELESITIGGFGAPAIKPTTQHLLSTASPMT
jgi:hypothetical protein